MTKIAIKEALLYYTIERASYHASQMHHQEEQDGILLLNGVPSEHNRWERKEMFEDQYTIIFLPCSKVLTLSSSSLGSSKGCKQRWSTRSRKSVSSL